MGRHGADEPDTAGPGAAPPDVAAPSPRRPRTLLITCLLAVVVVAVGVGLWWTLLRGGADPVGDHPASGTGTVVSSPDCAAGTGRTTLTLTGGAETSIDGCGFAVGQKLSVEYRADRTDIARLAGTSTAGAASSPAWLPWAILAGGVLAVGALLFLLFERRVAAPAPAPPVLPAGARSVAELRATMGLADRPVTRHAAPDFDAPATEESGAVR